MSATLLEKESVLYENSAVELRTDSYFSPICAINSACVVKPSEKMNESVLFGFLRMLFAIGGSRRFPPQNYSD